MRKYELDNIRGMTEVLVVVYHILYMYNGIETAGVIGPFSPNQPQDVFQYLVYPWFMLLLFVVSGMCARFALEGKDEGAYLKARTRKLLVPSTLGILVFGWILGYFNLNIAGTYARIVHSVPAPVAFLIMAFAGSGPLWFLQMLWLFTVLLVLIRRFEKDRLWRRCGGIRAAGLLGMTVPVYLSAQILNLPVILVYRFGIYGFGFFFGYFCLSHDEVMKRLKAMARPLCIGAALLGTAFAAVYRQKPYAEPAVLRTPLCCAFAWIATLAILGGMSRRGSRETAFTRWSGRRGWGLYILHYLPLAACAWGLKCFAPSAPAWLCYLLTGLSAFLGAILLDTIIRRIPLLRYAVLGVK